MSDNALFEISGISFWESCLTSLQEIYKETNIYETWLVSTEFLSIDEGVLELGVPNELYKDWISQHFLKEIKQVVSSKLNGEITIKFVVTGKKDSVPKLTLSDEQNLSEELQVQKRPAIKPYSRIRKVAQRVPDCLCPSHTFESFVVGDCNIMADQVAKTVANHPGTNQYNPLIIHGQSGMGKTHLLQAIARHAIENQTASKVLFRSSDQFLKDFISATKTKNFALFNKTYECADLLIIDDIQFLIGKMGTQEQLFKLFTRALSHQRQIVLSLDQNPAKLEGMDRRLLLRFESGLCCAIDSPDLNTRLEILRKKAQEQKLDLSEEVILWLAKSLETNVREIEGFLVSLLGLKDLLKVELTIENIKSLLGEKKKEQNLSINMDTIQDVVAKEFGVESKLFATRTRMKKIALPRKVAMYLCRTLTNLSFENIGLKFQRDYSTVIAAIKSLEEDMEKDRDLLNRVEMLKNMLSY
mgnify:CR=1 FL=1